MPSIQVFPDVVRAYNRVEVNWADLPQVTQARVLRVDAETGVCTPLRPYICFDGDFLNLSCGHGIFWDTEVPLDRSVYYITEGVDAPCVPSDAALLFLDTFTRTLVDDWGSTETGVLSPLAYLEAGGTVPGNYDVTAGKGLQTNDSVMVTRTATLAFGRDDFDLYADSSTNVVSLGASTASRIVARFTDVNNTYFAGINWDLLGNIVHYIARTVAGVTTILAINFAAGSYTPNVEQSMRFQGRGDDFKFKMWPTGGVEPTAWSLEMTDSAPTLTGQRVGLISIRDTGNTNANAVLSFDNFRAIDECVPCMPVTATSEPSTMPSNGAFRLKDPVRPCNDIYMPLCFEQNNLATRDSDGSLCIPGSGVFFASMETEAYAANSLILNPVNAKYPISVNRTRRAVNSTLTVVTRTFADRDNLLKINDPGSPLLLQGPPQYGIPDRYMAVSTVAVDRGLTDHKFQPRVVEMPHVEVARPAGPMQGPCGSQVKDLCDFTWQELQDAGFTWDDLVRGRAAGALGSYRTWDDVLTEFADWDAVDDGTRTWTGLEMGD